MNIRTLIEERADTYGDKTFLIFEEDGAEYTYNAFHEMTSRAARVLADCGIQKGDRVSILLPNTPEFLFVYLGAMKIGAVAAPINTNLKAEEIRFVIDNSESKILITEHRFMAEVGKILDELPRVTATLLTDDDAFGTTLAERMTAVEPEAPDTTIDPADEAMIIYTSGTTGKPKGVLLTHHNFIIDAEYIAEWFGFTEDDRMMCVLPLFHVNGEVVTIINPLYFGGSVVLNRKFSASRFWPAVDKYKVNQVSVVPTLLSILTAGEHPKDLGLDISSMKFIICGAAPLPVEVHKGFEEKFGVIVYEGYGLSETTCYSSFNPPDRDKRKIGSIGVAVGNEMCIMDGNCNILPPGQMGEICIRGENVMKGYFKRPEANEEAFAGGWFHSDDIGRMDEDGFYYILDRKKDMIIRGGENIYPREIDELLYEHPKIEAAATIGVPHEMYGEDVKSFVVLTDGSTATEAEVIDYCRERLADFKCPKQVAFVSEIPKGPTGKLLRRALREQEGNT